MRFFSLCLFLLVQSTYLVGQVKQGTFDVKSTVYDAETGETIPYANVFNKQQLSGTATNLDGFFVLPNCHPQDTIVVSYLGYLSEVIVVSNNMQSRIDLRPNTSLLHEIVVTAQSDFLYDLVAEVKKNRTTSVKKSKTYFFLESQIFDETVELIETYYNAEYSNYTLQKNDIKKGRIGLKPYQNRHFHSTESSQLFSMHDIFQRGIKFPENPFNLRKRQLKSQYSLDLVQLYQEGDSKVYVVEFKGRSRDSNIFEGTMWIDRTHGRLNKINMICKNATTHPFIAWPRGINKIQHVELEINKTYKLVNQEPFVHNIDFNYFVKYKDPDENIIEVSTRSFSTAFNYKEQFQLPFFEFSKQHYGLEDYRNSLVAPYDTTFWNSTNEFRFYDRKAFIDGFMTGNHLSGNSVYPSQEWIEHPQLEFGYMPWDEKRFIMSSASAKIIEKSESKPYESDRYNLNTKLYLDINYFSDSMTFQLLSVLDPVNSFFHYHMEDHHQAFLNMYFDLLEIQKRQLENQLVAIPNLDFDQVSSLYNDAMKAYQKTLDTFVEDTDRGTNKRGMKKWNAIIKEALQIDNMRSFELDSK